MSRSDSRPEQPWRLCLPPSAWGRVSSAQSRRVSQVPQLICPRAPSPTTPEGPMSARYPLLPHRVSGFTTLRRAGHLRLPNEAEMSSLALWLTSSPRQGFAKKDCSPRACRATCRTGNLQGELLSAHKISQACPGTSGRTQRTRTSALPRFPQQESGCPGAPSQR